MLHGHERAITQIRYNLEGDLLFSCAKDPQPNVWYSINGERLGTYKGHSGAVWCLDVSCILCIFLNKQINVFIYNCFYTDVKLIFSQPIITCNCS